MDTKTLKLVVWSDGDQSVGISGNSVDIDLGILPGEMDDANRAALRDQFEAIYADLWDGKVHSEYSDKLREEADAEALEMAVLERAEDFDPSDNGDDPINVNHFWN